jgi:hypothetical protein
MVVENVRRKEAAAADLSRTALSTCAIRARGSRGGMTGTVYHRRRLDADERRLHRRRRRDADDSVVDLSVYSPPFISLYTYTASERDMGNCANAAEFFEHFGFLIRELLRVTKPGRLTCCARRAGRRDARARRLHRPEGLPRRHHPRVQANGWIYHGEVCIDKDPQAQAIRTKAKGLLFVQMRKDSSWSRPALADYILVFRKPGENAVPIQPDITNEQWIEWARPIWYGIRESDTLHVAEARGEDDERHICPLQLGTIERCIRLWSNPGELCCRRSPASGRKATRRSDSGGGSSGSS